MCGRYFRKTPRNELAGLFKAELHASAEPAFNVAPTQTVLAVRHNPKTGERTLDDLRWGLIPFFAKDSKIGWKTINARAETVDSKPMYRAAFEKRRCLIPADGFFEWKTIAKKKQPYAIALESRAPFAFAGLWENWKDPETEQWVRTCSIVTTEANETVSAIHDRMPVILHPDDWGAWLGEEPAPPNELKALLRPYDGAMVMWPVSSRMNSPAAGAEGPSVLERVEVGPVNSA